MTSQKVVKFLMIFVVREHTVINRWRLQLIADLDLGATTKQFPTRIQRGAKQGGGRHGTCTLLVD